jgi:hypothetical protein
MTWVVVCTHVASLLLYTSIETVASSIQSATLPAPSVRGASPPVMPSHLKIRGLVRCWKLQLALISLRNQLQTNG